MILFLSILIKIRERIKESLVYDLQQLKNLQGKLYKSQQEVSYLVQKHEKISQEFHIEYEVLKKSLKKSLTVQEKKELYLSLRKQYINMEIKEKKSVTYKVFSTLIEKMMAHDALQD